MVENVREEDTRVPSGLWFREALIEWVREVDEPARQVARFQAVFDELREVGKTVRGQYRVLLASFEGTSRKVALLAGVSHETISKARRSREGGSS